MQDAWHLSGQMVFSTHPRPPRRVSEGKKMSNRAGDWLSQAKHDLQHAKNAAEAQDHDWACFAAQQAAEKAVKGLFLHLGGEGWGHAVTRLLQDLEERIEIPADLVASARRLDRHYIPTRYPNGFDTGIPAEYYTADEAAEAIADAERIYDFCHQSLR